MIDFRALLARWLPWDYDVYIRSEGWRRRAERLKRKFGYRCQLCNEGGVLNAHHRTYERLGYERDEDLTVLCDRCHRAVTLMIRNRRNG